LVYEVAHLWGTAGLVVDRKAAPDVKGWGDLCTSAHKGKVSMGLALIGSGIISFLMSFENFNTTLLLVSSEPPLTIAMFERMKEGSTPLLNAVSVFLMLACALLGLTSILAERERGANSR